MAKSSPISTVLHNNEKHRIIMTKYRDYYMNISIDLQMKNFNDSDSVQNTLDWCEMTMINE